MKTNQLFMLEGNGIPASRINSYLDKGYKLQAFAKADQLLAALNNKLPDLILCAGLQNESAGMYVLMQLKASRLTRHLPVIMIANELAYTDKLNALKAGADGAIDLGLYAEELMTMVKNMLENRAAWNDYYERRLLMPDHFYDLPSEDENFMKKINQFIKSNLSNVQLNVHQLAQTGSTSVSQLDRKLRKLVGYSPNGYLREYRLQVALQLLKEKKGNVSEVAFMTGFKSVSYFSVRFNERFGVKASSFRQHAVINPISMR